jgi:hypothetical protein
MRTRAAKKGTRRHDEIVVVNHDSTSSGYGDHPSLVFFARSAAGNLAPKRTIAGPLAGFTLPLGIALDLVRDEVIITNSYFNAADQGYIYSYPASGFGDIPPSRRLYGHDAKLCNPVGLVLDTLRNELVVANSRLSVAAGGGAGTYDESVATFIWPSPTETPAPIRRIIDSNGTPGATIPISVALFDTAPNVPVVVVPSSVVAEGTSRIVLNVSGSLGGGNVNSIRLGW